jgi:hypothetical protein
LGRKKPQLLRFGFAALFLVTGLAGCLLLYMALFSEHPCVSQNWNLVWLNPLQIVGFFWFLKPQKEGKIFGAYIRYAYHIIGGLVLAGFLLFWRWIPQQLNPANVPIILTLLLAAAHSIFVRPSELLNQ